MSEKIVQLNEEVIEGQIKELFRGSVEDPLNELLEAEAEKLTHAARYERRAAATLTSMWTGSICGGTGAESMKMWRYWWRLR